MSDYLRAIAERVKRECHTERTRLQFGDVEDLADFALEVLEANERLTSDVKDEFSDGDFVIVIQDAIERAGR